MMKELKSKMTTSISEVLETMFYMSLEFEEQTDINSSGLLDASNIRVCKLVFSGNMSGHFILITPESLLLTMAEDFMGESRENILKEHTDGIIKEVINMVAGNMFAALDDRVEFKLGIPEMVEDTSIINSLREKEPEGLVLAESFDGYLAFVIYPDS